MGVLSHARANLGLLVCGQPLEYGDRGTFVPSHGCANLDGVALGEQGEFSGCFHGPSFFGIWRGCSAGLTSALRLVEVSPLSKNNKV
jgi:hypothetical protein